LAALGFSIGSASDAEPINSLAALDELVVEI
jgi:hypothetical protein